MENTPPLPEQLGFTTQWYTLSSGLKMHAAVAGPADGPVVLLLHGFPEFWYSWRHQMTALAEAGYRVVAPDQRGYNLTDKTPPYDITTLTDDIAHLLDALGQPAVYLAGHDWGGAVSWVFAQRFSDRVRKLAVINLPHPAPISQALTSLRYPQQLRKSWYIFFFQIPGLPEWLLTTGQHANARRVLVSSSRRNTFSDADLAAYHSAWSQPGAMKATIGWYRALIRTGLHMRRTGTLDQWAQKIEPPTLILWGERDVALSVDLAEASVPYLRDGRLVRFPRATHWLHEEFPAEVTEHLRTHFQPA